MTMDFWLGYCLGVLSLIVLAVVVHLRQRRTLPGSSRHLPSSSDESYEVVHRPEILTYHDAQQLADEILRRADPKSKARKDIH